MRSFSRFFLYQAHTISVSLVMLFSMIFQVPASPQIADISLLEYDLNPPEYNTWQVYVKEGQASSLTGHLDVPSSHRGLNLDDKFQVLPVTVIWNLTSDISSVSIPSSIKRIEDKAFYYCKNLTSIVIPSTVEYVGTNAFEECLKLSSVVMSPGIESIGSFPECIKKGAYPIGSRTFVADIEVAYPVECIPTAEGLIFNSDKSAFYFAPWMISELELPSSVSLIGDKALAGCTKLNKLVVKSKIPPIVGEGAFDGANIHSIVVPSGSKNAYIKEEKWQQFEPIIIEQDFPDEPEIPDDPADDPSNNELKDGSFFWGDDDNIHSTIYQVISVSDKTCCLTKYGGQYIGKYEVPSSVIVNGDEYKVIKLGSRAYSWQPNMTEVVIPEGIVSIGEGAFIGCSALKQVVIPKSLENLDKEVFMDCESLIGINLPESLKQIGNKAFMNCTSLWRGAICGAVGDNAYAGCTALTTLDVHPSVISIGVDAFKDCTVLSSVRVSDISKWFEIDFANENSNPLKYSQYLSSSSTFKPINTLTIPNEISYLKDYCLYNYTSLTELIVPQNVKGIGNMVFANCTGLEKLDLGKPLSVGESFLSGCENLTTIVLNTSNPPVCNSESFAGFNRANCLLDIPEGSKETYLKNEEWSKFKSLKQPEEENKTEIILNHTMLTLHPKESSLLIATVNNSQTESPVLEWTSSNEKIATVSEQGMVKAVGLGTATITVTEGTVSAKCEVRVVNYEVTHIEVQPEEATLEVGESLIMVARVFPTEAPYPYLLWTSSDTSVVEIDENTGYVTAVSDGTAEIKAICQKDSGSQIFGSSIITVVPKSVVAIQLNETKLQLEQGSTFQLCATTFPDDKTDKTITWISGNEYVVKVDNTGLVTAIAEGTTYVSAWCGDVFAKCEIIVFENDVKGIMLDQKELTLEGATQIQLTATVTPSDATEQVIWESSNEKVVTVDDKGLITAQAPGKAVITVSCGRYSDNCEIEVLDVEPIFNISPDEAIMRVGETLQLNVTVEPENAFNKEIYFESLNEAVATVDENGLVTALAVGEVEIMCRGAVAKITVLPSQVIEDVVVNHIYYNVNISQGTASVSSSNQNKASYNRNLIIPSEIYYNGKSYIVTEIEPYAFYERRNEYGTLTLPSSLKVIGKRAFSNCEFLNGTLDIPESVLEIGEYAFFACERFTGDLVIPNTVKKIGNWAFYNCTGLNGSLIIKEGVTEIGENAFNSCYSLSGDLDIPASVKKIGYRAFWYCSGFNGSLVIHEGVEEIGEEAFYYCYNLTGDLRLPTSVTKIGSEAFEYCDGLTGDLIIPNSVKYIGKFAFSHCPGLTSVIIPNSDIIIGDGAFSYCEKLTSVNLPPSISSISRSLFNSCRQLTSVTMGWQIENIGDYAFWGCPIDEIFITAPNSPSIGESCFGKSEILHVQDEIAREAYLNSGNWSEFKNICTMTVPDALTVDHTSIRGNAGDTFQLTAKLEPEDVTLPYVFWRSTNPEIATVDHNGLVTIHKDDTIEALSEDGEELKVCKIIAETLYYNGPIAEVYVNSNVPTGVDNINEDGEYDLEADGDDYEEVYDLNGIKVANSLENLRPGFYIVRKGNKTDKIMIK